MKTTIRKYGWKRDLPDARDLSLSLPPQALPVAIDMRPKMPPVYDQGQTGSCTGNATGGAIEYCIDKEQLPDFVPSRLFLYYNGRVLEGKADEDSGSTIRDVIKGAVSRGFPHEDVWPFKPQAVTTKPTELAYELAKKGLLSKYLRVPQQRQALHAALAGGFPVVFGISVYESFESPHAMKSGNVPLPQPHEECLGGHAILLVGYDDRHSIYRFRNSWGTSFGQGGYGTLPYAYVEDVNLAADFWVIKAAR